MRRCAAVALSVKAGQKKNRRRGGGTHRGQPLQKCQGGVFFYFLLFRCQEKSEKRRTFTASSLIDCGLFGG